MNFREVNMFTAIWSVLWDIFDSSFRNKSNHKNNQQMETVLEQIQKCNDNINTLKWIVVVLALLVLALIGVVVFLYLQK